MMSATNTESSVKRKLVNILNPRSNPHDHPKCRVCLKPNGVINIHAQYSDFDVVQALQLCCDIEVKVNDIYPQKLCIPCLEFLKKAFEFRSLAKKSEMILRTSVFIKQEKEEIFQPAISTTYIGEKQNVKIEDGDKKPIIIKKEKNVKMKKSNIIKMYYEVVKDECSTQNPNVKCKLCAKIFKLSYMKSHLLSAHEKTYEGYVCDVCGKSFTHLPSFHIHKTVHSNVFPFVCNNCPFKAKNKNSLRIHMRIHTGIKNYACEECPAKFYTSSNLAKHKRSHGEPAFKCNICQRAYKTKKHMTYHIDTQHMGIRNQLPCTLCGNIYSNKKQLLKHELKKHGRVKSTHSRLPSYLKVQEINATNNEDC